jgi:hypothetical protein
MRRCIHIAITVLAIVGILRPFDCLAGTFTRKAAACCAKGKCLPSANADECCKNTVPGGNQQTAPKEPEHSTPLAALITATIPTVIALSSVAVSFDDAHAPPGSPPDSRLNLPLLI